MEIVDVDITIENPVNRHCRESFFFVTRKKNVLQNAFVGSFGKSLCAFQCFFVAVTEFATFVF